MSAPPRALWFFDYLSPFAYFELLGLGPLAERLDIEYRPVLLAGLLGHWGHKGPAEIPGKRVHTYRFCQWRAGREGIPLRFPAAHPFNPLPLLRLTIGLGSGPEVVRRIFDHVWAEGCDPTSPEDWKRLCDSLGVEDAEALVADPAVKDALRTNTEEATGLGVFGVPTFAIGGELFWGSDTLEMVAEFLDDPDLFQSEEMRRISDLPAAAARRG